jgi:predicted nucleotidyltransferase
MASAKGLPEKDITELIERLQQQTAGDKLQSVVLYGSAASGDYEAEYSDINLVCILKDTAFATLRELAPALQWWTKRRHPLPLVITRDELDRSTDVFVIEMIDMQQHHRVLFGRDEIASLKVSMHRHRAQLEYELREKLILLRQQMILAAGRGRRTWDLLLQSLPAFATLFRHVLIAQGQPVPAGKRETVKALSAILSCDCSPFEHVLDIREHRADRKSFDVGQLAARYLAAAEQVTAAVDRMLDSSASRG